MPIFPVNPTRFTPYDNTRFRVKWDGVYIPAITRISGLGRVTQITTFRDGAAASMVLAAPGINTSSPITIERGRTQDMAFENWNNLVWKLGAGAGTQVDLKNMRKDIRIELMNEAGQLVMAWNVYRCWPSEYHPIGELCSTSSNGAVESMVLQNEGWERDMSVVEPVEP